jgi:Zn-dependent peptidase ImmA (M78 family)/transcriptional regulator with XRE-family HTH domain
LIGARLRQARFAAGLSLETLASKLKRPLTKQTLSKYETNKAEPSTSTLMDLARALRVKPSFLLSEPEVSVDWVAYRKRASLSARDRETITAVATRRLESELSLRQLFSVGLEHALPHHIPVSDADSAESAAERVRESWGLGELPINGVIETIEDHGGIVLSWAEHRQFDGLSGWTRDEAPVIVINAAAEVDRRRFDAAHELGHLVMLLEVSEDEDERLAHRFAGAFLVPKSAALKELGTKRRTVSMPELGLLKERWGLSMQAWAHRARDLEIIDDGHYRQLNIEFRRRGWYRREPYRYEGREEPLLLRRLVWRALTEGIISSRDAEEICPDYEHPYEAAIRSKPSLRDLARLPREERHRILQSAQVEVDRAEVEDWDSIVGEGIELEPGEH